MNTVSMSIRTDPELKAQAEEILARLGMTMNGTINMFLMQIVREQAVPLNLSLNPPRRCMPICCTPRPNGPRAIRDAQGMKLPPK